MPIVEIDEKGRMTIPKKMGISQSHAIVISAGSFFITIPLSRTPQKDAENWLSTSKAHRELKIQAEKLAREDALNRAKRRNALKDGLNLEG